MTKKSELVQKLLSKVELRRPLPKPMKEATLLEQGMLAVLVRHMSQDKAEAAVTTLRKAYPDWNEMRVAQSQEIASHIAAKTRRASLNQIKPMLPAARDAREFLQEVFQKTHGLELEFMREDLAGAAKLVQQMPFTGLAGGSFLLWLASDRELPVHGALVRVLDRLGIVSRTASIKKARDLIEPLVGEGEGLTFVATFGEVADRWCDARKPICQECPLVEDCPYGKKVRQEWNASQVKLEAQRVKEEARRAILAKKDAARQAREAARLKKKFDAEAQKKERERMRVDRIAKKKEAAEKKAQAKLAAQQKKTAAQSDKGRKKGVLSPAPSKAGAKAQARKGEKAKPAKGGKSVSRAVSRPVRTSSKITRSPSRRRR